MYETSAVWTITGPDGTTVTFNDGVSGLYVETVAGFDSPNVRQNINDLPEYDGAVAGNAYFSSRPVTLTGKIAASSAAQRNALVVQLQQALRGLRGDVTLQSQPQGLPAMQATARLDNFRLSGGFVKDFQIALVCPDPRIYSRDTSTVVGMGTVSLAGAHFSWVFPADFGGGTGSSAAVTANNAGNFSTPPTVRVYGPATNPQIENLETGESIYLDSLTIGSGAYVDLDFDERTAVKDDGTNVYAHVRFPGSSWFTLDPGLTTVALFAGGTSAATELDVTWRAAWA